jgi:hypothetical protein
MNDLHKITIYGDGFVKRSVSDEFFWMGYDDNKTVHLNADAESSVISLMDLTC